MIDQPVHEFGKTTDGHVEHEGLLISRQRRPVQGIDRVLAVRGNKDHRLRQVSVRQRNPGIRGAPGGCGNARYDLGRKAGCAQRLELLAATGEHERVAALEPTDILARAHQFDEQCIDGFLGIRLATGPLADRNKIGVTSGQSQDLVRDEPIVHDHVGGLQNTQGADRQEIRITRPGPDKPGFSRGACPIPEIGEQVCRFLFRPVVLALDSELRHIAAEQRLPEAPPLTGICNVRLDMFAPAACQLRQSPEIAGQQGFNFLPDGSRQHRGRAARGYGDDERAPVDDGRCDVTAVDLVVDAVAEHLPFRGSRIHGSIDCCNAGRRYDEPHTVDVFIAEFTSPMLQTVMFDELATGLTRFRCNDNDARASAMQESCFT